MDKVGKDMDIEEKEVGGIVVWKGFGWLVVWKVLQEGEKGCCEKACGGEGFWK